MCVHLVPLQIQCCVDVGCIAVEEIIIFDSILTVYNFRHTSFRISTEVRYLSLLDEDSFIEDKSWPAN